ncbi:MAG TPA: ABC transporter permease [Nitrososphaerales archaeon]|nr:ABC transporter permease [Nitrososphaerales archaeon]
MSEIKESIEDSFTIAEMEARKIKHDSYELWIRSIQPLLWLLIFGEVFNAVHQLAPPGYTYLQYLTPGVLAQSVLFVAIFYGITIVWERDMGLLTKLLSSPSRISSVVVGKALAASIRGVFQAVVILALATIIRVNLNFGVFDVLGVFAVIVLFAMAFSSLSMLLASFFKTRDRMMGIGQAITMPLFFASNAIYPLSLMPPWLQAIAFFNPLSYVVDALRSMLLTGNYSNLPLDIVVLVVSTIIFVGLASLALRRIIE